MGHYESCYESDAEKKAKIEKDHQNAFTKELRALIRDNDGNIQYFDRKDKIRDKLEEALMWAEKK